MKKNVSLGTSALVLGCFAFSANAQFGTEPSELELIKLKDDLYVIHGALHLAGYDDTTAAATDTMRERERHYLATFGLARRELPSTTPDAPPPSP